MNDLVIYFKDKNYKDQDELKKKENKYAENKKIVHIFKLEKDIVHYLEWTTLPFVIGEKCNIDLNSLWNEKCKKCKTVLYRNVYPVGNLRPKYMVIGSSHSDKAEVSDLKYDRMWTTYGKVGLAHLLKRALSKNKMLIDCWFTNLIKCSTNGNRLLTVDECSNCKYYLANEIRALKPKCIITLGNHVYDMFTKIYKVGIPIIKIYHPSYIARTGCNIDEYAKHIIIQLRGNKVYV